MEFERRGSGRPLFLLHGFCSSSAIWRDLMAELAGTLVLCAISWRLIERPVIRWARRLSNSAAAGAGRRRLNIDAAGAV